ncbi:MAG: hypothetical protein IAG13_21570 [Deltaproteobacteria bacterium]|nr:hypothetical protein [Nannocystaceae bacterium]
MRVHVLHHAACFDGIASSAIFTAFYRARIDAHAEFTYIAKQHRPGDPFEPADFDADDVAVLDFRYTRHAKLGWFFDHHASAFQLLGERAHFDADRSGRRFYDPRAPSCTGFIAKIASEQFGFDAAPHTELLRWAELIDSAAFPDPQMPVALGHPALQLMTFAEHNRDPGQGARFIRDLIEMPIEQLAQADYVGAVLEPVLVRHAGDIALLGQRCDVAHGVIAFDLLDQPPRAYNKFIPYYHHPAIRYVVGLSIGPDGRIKLTAGYNPWLPRGEREHDISALCEQIGGGGHPFVGGASFARDAESEALAAQRWIVGVLRGAAPS